MFEDFEISPRALVLGLVGAVVAFFTASGGFSGGFSPPGGFFTKIMAALIGGVVGFIWGMRSS